MRHNKADTELKARIALMALISHQWLDWSHFDMSTTTTLVFVWLDSASVAQRSSCRQGMAIGAIPAYIFGADRCIICAPDAIHLCSKELCCLCSCNLRGWCCMEMFAKVCSGGTAYMYVQTATYVSNWSSKVSTVSPCKSSNACARYNATWRS